MWQILFHVTPVTVALASAALAVFALVTARAYVRDPQGARRFCRRLLAVASGVYLLVLASPVLSWGQVGESGRHITWNPLAWVEEWREANQPEQEFGQQLSDGTSAHYSVEPLTDSEREEIHSYGDGYDYFLHEDEHLDLVVLDAEGDPASDAEALVVRQEMGPAVADFMEYRDADSQSLIVEEKVVNVLLFVPIGIVAFFAIAHPAGKLAVGPLLSLAVETTQWALAAGASADAADLAANSIGSLTGTALAGASLLVALRFRKPQEAPEPASAV
ncbi:VanZ family protein [Nocardiopsis salina]|uniref:VanZ family protein n=1 Tax=Nocardiopsis salina TaxID=245836 RepID=UPI00034788CB|nr:VanZ family protein [Nocardiopsis salina]